MYIFLENQWLLNAEELHYIKQLGINFHIASTLANSWCLSYPGESMVPPKWGGIESFSKL